MCRQFVRIRVHVYRDTVGKSDNTSLTQAGGKGNLKALKRVIQKEASNQSIDSLVKMVDLMTCLKFGKRHFQTGTPVLAYHSWHF